MTRDHPIYPELRAKLDGAGAAAKIFRLTSRRALVIRSAEPLSQELESEIRKRAKVYAIPVEFKRLRPSDVLTARSEAPKDDPVA